MVKKLTLWQLRTLFIVLEQQRVTRDAVDNMGRPDPNRLARKMADSLEAREKG